MAELKLDKQQNKKDQKNQKNKQEQNTPNEEQLESQDSGIVSPVKDEILNEHYREHPEGDPAVRRIRPDRGEIPITERQDDGFMKVIPPEKKERKAS